MVGLHHDFMSMIHSFIVIIIIKIIITFVAFANLPKVFLLWDGNRTSCLLLQLKENISCNMDGLVQNNISVEIMYIIYINGITY